MLAKLGVYQLEMRCIYVASGSFNLELSSTLNLCNSGANFHLFYEIQLKLFNLFCTLVEQQAIAGTPLVAKSLMIPSQQLYI